MQLPRSSGIVLHPTSLPDGRLGGAYEFVDWLEAAGQSWWQVLPLGPPDEVGSPYASESAFAAWSGFLAEPDARVTKLERAAFRKEHAFWARDWEKWGGDLADQVRFQREWTALREYAGARGIRLIGDVPIYVAWGSVDHRAHPELFLRGACRRRSTRQARPSRAALGQPALRLGRAGRRGTAGGSSACAGTSSSST